MGSDYQEQQGLHFHSMVKYLNNLNFECNLHFSMSLVYRHYCFEKQFFEPEEKTQESCPAQTEEWKFLLIFLETPLHQQWFNLCLLSTRRLLYTFFAQEISRHKMSMVAGRGSSLTECSSLVMHKKKVFFGSCFFLRKKHKCFFSNCITTLSPPKWTLCYYSYDFLSLVINCC